MKSFPLIEKIRIKVPPSGVRGLFVLLLILFSSSLFSQPSNYWQQKVNYKIDVSLNDTAYTLDGYISMDYYNNSPDTLHFIWFHVWPNAYKNDRTAFSDQLLENGRKDFYFSNDDKRGYINRLDFKVDKKTALMEDHPQHQDIIKLLLPKPLVPGSSVKIETPFHVKLPYNFSRGGHINQSFQITQWYPKPAVYDKYGWHEMPYLDQGEFYSEFGEYDVQVTLPKDYVVAATGKRKNETDNGETKTLHFVQENIHDFAWFADKHFSVMKDTMQLGSRIIDVYSYFNEANSKAWINSTGYIKSSIRTKCEWVGEYPYDIVSVVEKPGKSEGGGMEYPTITLIDQPINDRLLNEVIEHEVGHNWFYGILATNERQHPWMDEGINTYYDKRYMLQQYGNESTQYDLSKSSFIQKRLPTDADDFLLKSLIQAKQDQPIETVSENFSDINYGSIVYYKTAQWMKLLESELGRPLFDKVMKEYYNRWKFKHPYPEDFKNIVQEVSGKNVDSIFSLLNKNGDISIQKIFTSSSTPFSGKINNRGSFKKKIKLISFFSLKSADKYNYIFVSPAIGYNYYDKFMVGIILHNYTLPSPKFRFILAPLYATNSKQFNGIGNINYTSYSYNKINKIVLGATAARFSTNQSLDTAGNKIFENFYKVVPYFQLYFRHPARSHTTSWFDLRTYLIGEQQFAKFENKANSDSSVFYPVATNTGNRSINQLSFNVISSRLLYPYDYQLKFQQGKGFYRFDLNANYFFNYVKGGGMQVRLFASKFGYFSNDHSNGYQYQPRLLAATGEEDYTYSNYFLGRSASTAVAQEPVKNLGIGAQQLMIRDGGLKLRVDQYGYLQGASENWVAALNFNTTLPDIFPVKLPLRIFFDVGTYAEGWKDDAATSKFLYVGGLQLSLFKNVLNIYAPLVYNKEFKDVLKTDPERNKFFKKVTFSINIQNISFKKFFPQISF
ncbi:MAG: M1 family metallopeptidase [Ferruginibacter sp.]